MIGERTRAGLSTVHKWGVAIGRTRALTPDQILLAEAMTARRGEHEEMSEGAGSKSG